jgi:hypothetical protein
VKGIKEYVQARGGTYTIFNEESPGGMMYGYSKDGVIEIRFVFNSDGSGTYYAIKK